MILSKATVTTRHALPSRRPAALAGRCGAVRALLAARADPADGAPLGALCLAADRGHAEVVATLCAAAARPAGS